VLSVSLLLAALAAFLAGVLSGFPGFGLAVIVVPLLLLVYDPKTVVALVAVLSTSVATAVVRDSWREADRRVVLRLLAPALPGLAAGAEVLRVGDPAYIQLGTGVLVIASAALLLRDVRLPGAGTRWGTLSVGLASGALASSTGLSGPPAALLLTSRGLPKRRFRATISLYFLGLDLALLAVLALWGILTPELAPLALFLVAATLVGKALGTALLGRIAQEAFRVVVLSTVVFAGALGIATAARVLVPQPSGRVSSRP
jgi:uncharacterized membrane protein YfcA